MGKRFNTAAVTGSYRYDTNTGATTVPLVLSNAYQFKNADNAAKLFNLEEDGYIYSRLNNPTNTELESRLAMLEGGTACLVTSSGQFAELLVASVLCRNGDEIISASNLYGGTTNLFAQSLKNFGITVHFADPNKPDEWEKLINEKTKLFFIESITNPSLEIPDFENLSKISSKYGLPLVVDNTVATPFLFRPKDYGANIVVHSTTKFLTGSASVLGGALIDLGNFDWKASNKFPNLTEPSASYHGLIFADAFAEQAFAVCARATFMRDFGGTASPFNSFITLLGVQTLHVRLPRHMENALALIKFLQNHPSVESVIHPSLSNHPSHTRALKLMPKGAGSLIAFNIKGGYDSAKKFIESLNLCIHGVNIGDVRTIVTHPASTTHRQCSDEQLKACGITKNFIRISAGIEDILDIISDISGAFNKI